MTTASPPDRAGAQLTPVGIAADRCVKALQERYLKDESTAVATLARLRKGLGKPVHSDAHAWGVDALHELDDMRAQGEYMSVGAQGKRDEEAVHLAVTLWALHQQSVRDDRMHRPGWGLGKAVRALGPRAAQDGGGDDPNDPLRKRFVRVGTASSLETLAVRLREIVTLLRSERVPLDYGRLAEQVAQWQNPARRAAVRRAWGRDYHLASRRPGGGSEGTAPQGDPNDAFDHD